MRAYLKDNPKPATYGRKYKAPVAAQSLGERVRLRTRNFTAFDSDVTAGSATDDLSDQINGLVSQLNKVDMKQLNNFLVRLLKTDVSKAVEQLKGEGNAIAAAKLSCLHYIASRTYQRDRFIIAGHPQINDAGEPHHGFSLFQKECYGADTKLNAAVKLLSNLQDPSNVQKLTEDEFKAAKQGRLGGIVKDYGLPLPKVSVARATELTALDPLHGSRYGG
ncbi:MAG: hypothetical protein P1U34_11945 [Coxiellaceae bacterium]|nr:hypothetical protein [Coxiellaceae bacterium]